MTSKATIYQRKERSKFLYAFPNFLDCADLMSVLKFQFPVNTAQDWLNQIDRNERFQLNFSKGGKIQQNIKHFYVEALNQKKLKGKQNLYIGYPIILQLDQQDLKSLPIYLVPIDLIPNLEKDGEWLLKKNVDKEIKINPSLLDALSPSLKQHLLQSDPFKLDGLEQLGILLDIEFEQGNQWKDFPDSKNWDLAPNQSRLYLSAVIGNFPPPLFAPAPDLAERQKTEELFRWPYHFGHLPLDPSQKSAINQLYSQKDNIILGNAGTGKKQVAKYLLSNALLNAKKTLVISGRRSSILNFQSELEQLQLSDLSFWMQNSKLDIPLLFALIEGANLKENKNTDYNSQRYQKLLDEIQGIKMKTDNAFRAIRRPTFGPFDWTQTIGLLLKSQAKSGKEILNTHLINPDLQYKADEYAQIAQIIGKAQQLFEKVNTQRHPLRRLNDQIFLSLELEEASNFVKSKLHFFIKQYIELQQLFIAAINQYRKKLDDHFNQYRDTQLQKIEAIENQIDINTNAFGKAFISSPTASLLLKSTFSSKDKNILAEREKIYKALDDFSLHFKSIEDFEFDFPDIVKLKGIKNIQKFLTEFKVQLNNWAEGIPQKVEKACAQLKYDNARPAVKMQNDFLNLEARLDQTLIELNQSGLLQDKWNNTDLAFPQKQEKIEALIEFLENLALNIRDFDDFHPWQAFWLNQNLLTQDLISAIIRAKPQSWVVVFESWYLQHLLDHKQVNALPNSAPYLDNFRENTEELRHYLPSFILQLWQRKREEAQKILKKTIIKGAADSESLNTLMKEQGKIVTDLIPVFFLNLDTATKIFKDIKEPLFDLIILESAQFLDARQGFELKKLARQNLLIGDGNFVHEDEKADLLEYALKQQITPSNLQFTHQLYPGHLWQLSKNLNLGILQNFNQRHTINQSIDQYDEENRINKGEAKQIIDFLLHFERNAQRTFPSIAIVTSSIQQRNWIAAQLLEYKRQKNTEEKAIIQQMERNGLLVLHLEELEANRFDILVFSATFGHLEKGKALSPHVAYFNSQAGVRQLSELMALGSKEVHLFHTFTSKELQSWANNPGEEGFFLYANYALMIAALINENSKGQEEIIEKINSWYNKEQLFELSHPIYDEIAHRIRPYLPEIELIRDFEIGAFKLPLVLHPGKDSNRPKIAILVDSFLSKETDTNILWEMEQKEKLKLLGIHLLSSWSYHWWKEPEKTAKILSQEINSIWQGS